MPYASWLCHKVGKCINIIVKISANSVGVIVYFSGIVKQVLLLCFDLIQTALITSCGFTRQVVASICIAIVTIFGFPKAKPSTHTTGIAGNNDFICHVNAVNADAFCSAIYKAISLPFNWEGYSSLTFAGFMVKSKPKSVKNCFLLGEFDAKIIA